MLRAFRLEGETTTAEATATDTGWSIWRVESGSMGQRVIAEVIRAGMISTVIAKLDLAGPLPEGCGWGRSLQVPPRLERFVGVEESGSGKATQLFVLLLGRMGG